MERERFDFTPGRDFGRQEDSSDEFDGTRTRIGNIVQQAVQVAHGTVTAQLENHLQQMRQQGAQ